MNTNRLTIAALGSFLLCSPAWLIAQPPQDQPQENVVEAARKAQSAKKTAPKAKLVIDNDNLGTLRGIVNVVGQEPAPAADQTKAATDDKSKAPADKADKADKAEVKGEDYWRKQFADANKKLNED